MQKIVLIIGQIKYICVKIYVQKAVIESACITSYFSLL